MTPSKQVRFGRMPKPARCKRAFPGFPALSAFTIIELLIVMAVIIILAGLILVAAGYVREKGYRSRAEAEIAAISAAIESYKVDNGIYPRGNADLAVTTPPYDTDTLDAKTGLDPQNEINPDPRVPGAILYVKASLALYKVLSGDIDGNRQPTAKSYFSFPPGMLWPRGSGPVTALVDAFGNCYGYSTANQDTSAKGFNPTFDLWSTAGSGTGATPTPNPAPTPEKLWIKNW